MYMKEVTYTHQGCVYLISLKGQHLFEIEVLIVFITFNQFNGSFLNKCSFLSKKKKTIFLILIPVLYDYK